MGDTFMKELLKYMKNKKVGSTPTIYYNNIFYKLEFYNPSGSIKDRAAYNILENYYGKGAIHEGDTIVIASSGNMGIALAYFGKKFRIKVVVVMPNNVSRERINILTEYNATIILTNSELGMIGSIDKARELSKEYGYILINQFDNIYNKLANISTGKEIIQEIPNVDYIVCGIGSGGTISGICEYLKQNNQVVKVIGVEPNERAVISKKSEGENLIEGLGAGFIPPLINLNDIYNVKTVKGKEVLEKFKEDNPLLLGLSSIACDIVARKILEKEPNAKIVVIVADGIDRYGGGLEWSIWDI